MNTCQRFKHLQRINRLLKCPHFSSRMINWMYAGALHFALALSFCLEKWGWGWEQSTSVGGSLLTILMASLCLSCTLIAMFPSSGFIREQLEQAIADYDPVDLALYRNLCNRVERDGRLDNTAIAAWVAQELECVARPLTRSERSTN